jgi:hypothetical protein
VRVQAANPLPLRAGEERQDWATEQRRAQAWRRLRHRRPFHADDTLALLTEAMANRDELRWWPSRRSFVQVRREERERQRDRERQRHTERERDRERGRERERDRERERGERDTTECCASGPSGVELSDEQVANRDVRVWHGATENGP